MDETFPNNPPLATPAAVTPILSYLSNMPARMVTVGRYRSAIEAALRSAELAANGIPNTILNGNVNALGIHFASFTEVELQVHELYSGQARDILDRVHADDLEPAEIQPGHPLDERGNPVRLAVAQAFDKVRDMLDARTILGSGGVETYLPRLIRRGDSPPGVGRRFVLQVREEDMERARTLLDEAQNEEEDNDPRCPQCGSRRTYPVSDTIRSLLGVLRLASPPQKLTDCMACHYRGPTAEFDRSSRSGKLNSSPDKTNDFPRE